MDVVFLDRFDWCKLVGFFLWCDEVCDVGGDCVVYVYDCWVVLCVCVLVDFDWIVW